jgi:AbrB family looped-hinge helix DNA binding protein
MATYITRLTSQGQVSIPAEVRKALGVGPGSAVVWEDRGNEVIVRRKTSYSWDDMHRALFPSGPAPVAKTLDELDAGKAAYVKERHARGRY